MKTTLLNIRLETSQIEKLDELAGEALNRQAVGRMLLIAAIDAVRRNQGKLTFPPKFEVRDETPFAATSFRINEPKTTKK